MPIIGCIDTPCISLPFAIADKQTETQLITQWARQAEVGALSGTFLLMLG
ncbi:hypothetical protein M5G07_01280 [Serratia symbiotica]|nr:hypothetical protein [Serratia symbiotica]